MWQRYATRAAIILAVVAGSVVSARYIENSTLEGALVLHAVGLEQSGAHSWSTSWGMVTSEPLVRGPFSTDVSFAADGTRAELKKIGSYAQVVLTAEAGEYVRTSSETLKRDLVWAPNGLSLAYAEADPKKTLLGNPNSWTVVRVLKNGDALTVGHGIRPQPVLGSETLMLTQEGIVRVRIGEAPELVVASAKKVYDTPLAATRDGSHIAWVNPADASLQVFTQSAARTYTPHLTLTIPATSLRFSPDGSYLMATTEDGVHTTLLRIRVKDGVVSKMGTVLEPVRITDWYE